MTGTINILTIVDENYYNSKMGPWMQNASRAAVIDPEVFFTLITLDFDAPTAINSKYPGINTLRMNSEGFSDINSNHCCQHGTWIHLFPEAREEDVFIVVDGDAIPQRPLTTSEKAYFSQLGQYEMSMNWNAGTGDTLAAEAARIWPLKPIAEILHTWCQDKVYDCHNAGVMAAKMSCWKPFYELYVSKWEETELYFNHIARQQWLINWCAQTYPFNVSIMDYSLHSQGHYGLNPGVTHTNNQTWYKDELVLFSHKINWQPGPP